MKEKCSINQNKAEEKRQFTQGRKYSKIVWQAINYSWVNKCHQIQLLKNRLSVVIKILRLSSWIKEKHKL